MTTAYVSTNPPRLMVPSMGGGQQWWSLKSTVGSTDASQTGWITDNATSLGMREGDIVIAALGASGSRVTAIGNVTAASTTGATITWGNLTSTI